MHEEQTNFHLEVHGAASPEVLGQLIELLGTGAVKGSIDLSIGVDPSAPDTEPYYNPRYVTYLPSNEPGGVIPLVTSDSLRAFADSQPEANRFRGVPRIWNALSRSLVPAKATDLAMITEAAGYPQLVGIYAGQLSKLLAMLANDHTLVDGLGYKTRNFLESYNRALHTESWQPDANLSPDPTE